MGPQTVGSGGGWLKPAAGGVQKSRLVWSLGRPSGEENEKGLLPGNVAGFLMTSLKIPIL